MTQPDETPLSASEGEVRRLLADARHTGPVPPEVAARLDGVLAGLAAGDHDDDVVPGPSAAPVTDLDVHRRRRRVGQLLVAAAAVVVAGIGIGQVLDRAGDRGTSSESTAADAPATTQDDSLGAGAGAGAEPQTSDSDGVRAPKQLAEVRPRSFDRDVRQLVFATYDTRSELAGVPGTLGADRAAGAICRSRSWGSGTFVPVSYGGSPAVLVLRTPQGDTQVADLYLCGATAPVRSVTLPAR